MKITKKKIIELFNSLDDDVEIEFSILVSKHWEKGKLKQIGHSHLSDWLEKQDERKTPQWMIDFLDKCRRKIGCSLDYDETKDMEDKILCIKEWLEKQGEKPTN